MNNRLTAQHETHKDNYNTLSKAKTCGPCSAFKHVLWVAKTFIYLDRQIDG